MRYVVDSKFLLFLDKPISKHSYQYNTVFTISFFYQTNTKDSIRRYNIYYETQLNNMSMNNLTEF